MPSTFEILKRDIPILEKRFGSDSRFVQQLKEQLADIEKEPDPEETPPETEEYHAMIIPNPKAATPPSKPGIEGDRPKVNAPSREMDNKDQDRPRLPNTSDLPGIGSEESRGAIVNGDYSETLQRRIDQFAGYLRKMFHRSQKEIEGSCFLVFDEKMPKSGNDLNELNEAVNTSIELVLHGMEISGGESITMDDRFSIPDVPEEGWRKDNSQSRFIQFSFEEKWFCIDMPIQTLFP